MANEAREVMQAWKLLTRTIAHRFPATASHLRADEYRLRRMLPPRARHWRARRGGR